MYEFIKNLQTTMPIPPMFGWFHIIFLLFTLAGMLVSIFFIKKLSDKKVRIILFALWFCMIVLEVFKQIMNSFAIVDGAVVVSYVYGVFPWQICSMPFYFLPFVIFMPDCKVRDLFINLMSCLLLIAGLSVVVNAKTVFDIWAYINSQSMIHHSFQTIAGTIIAVYYFDKLSFKNYAKSFAIMAGCGLIAIALNETFFYVCGCETNLFFIGRHNPVSHWMVNAIYSALPYWFVVVLLTIFIFLLGVLMLYIIKGINKLKNYCAKKKESAN